MIPEPGGGVAFLVGRGQIALMLMLITEQSLQNDGLGHDSW